MHAADTAPEAHRTSRQRWLSLNAGTAVKTGVMALLAAAGVTAAEPSSVPRPDAGPSPRDDRLRWSAQLQVGAVGVRSNSRTQPEFGTSSLSSLEGRADHRRTVQAAASGVIAVALGNGQPECFVELPMDESGLAAGVRIGTGIGRLSLVGFMGFEEEIWRQPYVADQARERTDQRAVGADCGLEGIAGSAIDLSWTLRSIGVEADDAGRLWPALDRSGLVQTLTLAGTWTWASMAWQPRLGLDRSDLDGRAASSDGVHAGLAVQLPWRGVIWSFDGEVGLHHHRAGHPIFDDRRQDAGYQGIVSATLPELCGWRGVTLTGLVGVMGTASNLDFYDETTLLAGLLVGYTFDG